MKFSFASFLLLGLLHFPNSLAFHAPSFLPAPSSKLHGTSAPTREDLLGNTVPVLKDILRSAGEKVSGRKSELIDRILALESPQPNVAAVKEAPSFSIVEEEDVLEGEEDVTEIPTLPPLSIKILRKAVSRLRPRGSLPLHSFASSPSSIDPVALSTLDQLLDKNELVEAKGIMKSKNPMEVRDAISQIAATLQVAVVERKGFSAVFFRPSANGEGVKLYGREYKPW
mmetsp:Transcript_5294/g.11180  ORF Transcript_5294/g.11180 Transcript_5294/m.11180 type:complete len:227 (+) Transcript_5294:167-847(+)